MAVSAVVTALLTSPAGAQVRTLPEPLKPGATQVEIFFVNESDRAVTFDPPSTVSTTRGGGFGPVIVHARAGSPVTIAAAGFVKLIYGEAPADGGLGAQAAESGQEDHAAAPEVASGGTASTGFLGQLEAHQPMYIIYGGAPDRVKLQFSFAVPVFEYKDGGAWRFAYTQTQLWAVEQISWPFTATTYSPQFGYTRPLTGGSTPIQVTAGIAHDSTGEGARRLGGRPRSRDVNRLFARFSDKLPIDQDWSVTGALSGHVYVWTKGLGADNISDYWGNGSVELSLEKEDGPKLSAFLRGNPRTGKGAAEINASLPARMLSPRAPPLYLFGQLFTGYGESLLDYGQERTRVRVGIGFVR